MPSWESIDEDHKKSLLCIFVNWQQNIIKKSFISIPANELFALDIKINDSSGLFDFDREIYFLKKSQLTLLEKFTLADGRFIKNTRLAIRSFGHFLNALGLLKPFRHNCTDWTLISPYVDQISSACFRLAVYVHQNTGSSNSTSLPPTYFIESDEPVPEIETVRKYLQVLYSSLIKQIRETKKKNYLKSYRLILKRLLSLADLMVYGKTSLILKIDRCIDLYAHRVAKEIRLIREYLIQISCTFKKPLLTCSTN